MSDEEIVKGFLHNFLSNNNEIRQKSEQEFLKYQYLNHESLIQVLITIIEQDPYSSIALSATLQLDTYISGIRESISDIKMEIIDFLRQRVVKWMQDLSFPDRVLEILQKSIKYYLIMHNGSFDKWNNFESTLISLIPTERSCFAYNILIFLAQIDPYNAFLDESIRFLPISSENSAVISSSLPFIIKMMKHRDSLLEYVEFIPDWFKYIDSHDFSYCFEEFLYLLRDRPFDVRTILPCIIQFLFEIIAEDSYDELFRVQCIYYSGFLISISSFALECSINSAFNILAIISKCLANPLLYTDLYSQAFDFLEDFSFVISSKTVIDSTLLCELMENQNEYEMSSFIRVFPSVKNLSMIEKYCYSDDIYISTNGCNAMIFLLNNSMDMIPDPQEVGNRLFSHIIDSQDPKICEVFSVYISKIEIDLAKNIFEFIIQYFYETHSFYSALFASILLSRLRKTTKDNCDAIFQFICDIFQESSETDYKLRTLELLSNIRFTIEPSSIVDFFNEFIQEMILDDDIVSSKAIRELCRTIGVFGIPFEQCLLNHIIESISKDLDESVSINFEIVTQCKGNDGLFMLPMKSQNLNRIHNFIKALSEYCVLLYDKITPYINEILRICTVSLKESLNPELRESIYELLNSLLFCQHSTQANEEIWRLLKDSIHQENDVSCIGQIASVILTVFENNISLIDQNIFELFFIMAISFQKSELRLFNGDQYTIDDEILSKGNNTTNLIVLFNQLLKYDKLIASKTFIQNHSILVDISDSQYPISIRELSAGLWCEFLLNGEASLSECYLQDCLSMFFESIETEVCGIKYYSIEFLSKFGIKFNINMECLMGIIDKLYGICVDKNTDVVILDIARSGIICYTSIYLKDNNDIEERLDSCLDNLVLIKSLEETKKSIYSLLSVVDYFAQTQKESFLVQKIIEAIKYHISNNIFNKSELHDIIKLSMMELHIVIPLKSFVEEYLLSSDINEYDDSNSES